MDALTLNWPGGEHEFALRLGELRKLQDNCQAGPEEVLNRIRLGQWRVDDIYETIRLGLIGGGMPNSDAGPLVKLMFDQNPIVDFKLTAMAIMMHALFGPPDDTPEKPEGATASPESGSSAPSTESEDT